MWGIPADVNIAYIVTLNSCVGNPSWSCSLIILSPALSNTLIKDPLHLVIDESSSSGTSSSPAATFSLAIINPPFGLSPFTQRWRYDTRSSVFMCECVYVCVCECACVFMCE